MKLRQIVQKEVLLHLKEARFAWVAGLFCGLVLLGLVLMSLDYSQRLQGYQASLAAERQQMFAVDGSEPIRRQVRGLTNARGIYAFRSPQVLGALSSGWESFTPTQIHVSDTRSWSRQANETFYRNPLLSLFPRPDFSYIVASILSLVALFFTFDAICGEKESGTLKLVLSMGVSRDQLLVGKWAGSILTLGIPFVLAATLGISLFVLVGGVSFDSALLVRIFGIVVIALIYLSLFITFGLMISVLVSRPASSLLICLTLWVGVTFVLPNMLASMGRFLSPIPTFQQIKMRKRALDLEREGEEKGLAALVENGTISDEERKRRREILRQESEAEKGRIDGSYLRKLEQQVEVSQAVSRASPTACFVYATAELSDTGLGFYRRTHEAYDFYRTAFRDYARDLKRKADSDQLGEDWLKTHEIPLLTIGSQGLGEAFGTLTTELIVLLLFQLSAFIAAYVGFLRYDAR